MNPAFLHCFLSTDNGTDALCAAKDPGLKKYLYVFMFGQFLHGIGGTTLYSIGVVYIDDNVKTTESPLYTGENCSSLREFENETFVSNV